MRQAEPYLQTWWDWRAAGNFMFGGTGSGLIAWVPVAAVVASFITPPLIAGLLLMSAGLGLVWLEIGRRLRAMNVFRHPHLSWMTRESFAAVLTFLLAFVTLWLIFRNGGQTSAQALLLLAFCVASALAALAFLYCQARILKASKGIPAWRESKLMAFIIATGLTEGLAALLLLMALMFAVAGPGAVPVGGTVALGASAALTVLVGARMIAWRRYHRAIQERAPDKAVAVLAQLDRWLRVAGGWLPLVLAGVSFAGTLALAVGDRALLAPGLLVPALHLMIAAALVLALLTGWYAKFVIIARASYTQGFAIPKRPARGPRGTGGAGTKPGWT